MSKLLSALIAAGFAFGLTGVVAQNVDSDKDKAQGQEQIMQEKEGAARAGQAQPGQTQSEQSTQGTTRNGQTQVGQGQMRSRHYSQMRERCSTMTGDVRDQCLSTARSQYLTSATSRCERLTDSSMKQQCFNDVQSAVGLPTTGQASTGPTSAGTEGNQSDTVKRGEDEDKPGRQ